MRIFTKKQYELKTQGGVIITRPLSFMDVPEYVKDQLIFQWAVKDGSITVVETVAAQKALENEGDKPARRNKREKKMVEELQAENPS